MKLILIPAFLYVFIWSSILIIYNLKLSYVLLPLNVETYVYLVGSIFAFLLGLLTISLIKGKLYLLKINHTNIRIFIDSKSTKKSIKLLSLIAITGVLIEIIYFQNIPILSALGYGRAMRYTEFGFPGIHGLFNAMYLVVSSFFFLKQLVNPEKKNLIILLLLLLWPMLLMTRQLFISLFIQLLFLFLIFKDVKVASVVKILLMILISIYLFGMVGDFRSGRDSFLALAQPTFEYPEYLPTGFFWAYIYITSPVNNVINNINIIPNYIPLSTVIGIFPSFLRDFVSEIVGGNSSQWILVNETLNVSSIHQKILTDFGIEFGLVFIFITSLITQIIYHKSIKDIRYTLALSVLLHSIALSFFVDFLFNLVFISQILIYLLAFKRCKEHIV